MPIEMVFSQWRRLVCREELDNEDVLVNRILTASKKISKKLQKFYKHQKILKTYKNIIFDKYSNIMKILR